MLPISAWGERSGVAKIVVGGGCAIFGSYLHVDVDVGIRFYERMSDNSLTLKGALHKRRIEFAIF